jgi:hypothetical protein
VVSVCRDLYSSVKSAPAIAQNGLVSGLAVDIQIESWSKNVMELVATTYEQALCMFLANENLICHHS